MFRYSLFFHLSLLILLITEKRCKQLLKKRSDLTEMDMQHYIVNISGAQTLVNPKHESSVNLLADMIDTMGGKLCWCCIVC